MCLFLLYYFFCVIFLIVFWFRFELPPSNDCRDPLIVMVCECQWSNPLLASIQTQLCEIQFDAEISTHHQPTQSSSSDSEIIEDARNTTTIKTKLTLISLELQFKAWLLKFSYLTTLNSSKNHILQVWRDGNDSRSYKGLFIRQKRAGTIETILLIRVWGWKGNKRNLGEESLNVHIFIIYGTV